MPGNPGNTIPIMVNSNKLIPDTLGFAINIQEITKTDITVNHESKIYLREVVGTCEGHLLIPNFMTEETEHIVTFIFYRESISRLFGILIM